MIDKASLSSSVGQSADGTITLPPSSPSPPPETAVRPGVVGTAAASTDNPPTAATTTVVLNALLVILVLALWFFLASFPARNTDLWLHMATGRALLEGKYQFGVAPF